MSDAGSHRPVLLEECLAGLQVKDGGVYVDVTLGRGGHAERLLDRVGPTGSVVGVDRDPDALAAARTRLERYGVRMRFVHGNFDRFDEQAGLGPASADGILADLGVSSPQLDLPERGFSLMRAGPLDMRMDPTHGPSAKDLLRQASTEELEGWLREAGEMRFARKLARRLSEHARELETTEALAEAVCRWVPRRAHSHPATRVFLALRMAVNREKESLEGFLKRAPAVLKPGGRLAVISFHSGEDRVVKWFGRERASAGVLRIVTKKPVEPTERERADNPRSRSAKLRVFEKI